MQDNSMLQDNFPSQQPQAFTLANPFIIPFASKKTKAKKIRVKDSVCIGENP